MIDNPTQVDRLMGKLQQALPLPARPTPELARRPRREERCESNLRRLHNHLDQLCR